MARIAQNSVSLLFLTLLASPAGAGSVYQFEDEQSGHPVVRGALAMANAGPNTNGSQFFIVTADAAPWLDGKHTVFGQVTSGQDVVDAISEVERDSRDKPKEPVRMTKVAVAGATA